MEEAIVVADKFSHQFQRGGVAHAGEHNTVITNLLHKSVDLLVLRHQFGMFDDVFDYGVVLYALDHVLRFKRSHAHTRQIGCRLENSADCAHRRPVFKSGFVPTGFLDKLYRIIHFLGVELDEVIVESNPQVPQDVIHRPTGILLGKRSHVFMGLIP